MIDVTKCLGCRKGIDVWTKRDDKIKHMDLFASADAGSMYDCETPGIEEHLIENENGMLRPKPEFKSFFEKQSWWWDDILDLAYEVFQSSSVVQEFFNSGKEGELIHTLPNERIENALVNMANVAGVVVNEDTYPDLIQFKTKK